ncbi:MAG: efflux RND transporter periplasmic adaptor subunit [Gammaproteobacteria bacterium]
MRIVKGRKLLASTADCDMFSNDRPTLLLTAALAAVFLNGCSRSSAEGHTRAEPVVPVVIAPVERRSVPITVRAVGSVEAIASVAIVSRVDGPIERVFVADGQEVVAGQPLVQLDPAPLRIQVRMNEANLQRDTAKQSDARSKEERGRPLLEQHYISPDDYAQLKSNLESATATVAADRATLDQAKLQLTYTTIRAPAAGKIGHVALQTGNMVRASTTEPLTILNSIDSVDVSFTVPERNLQAVRRAAEAHEAIVTLTDAGAPMTANATQPAATKTSPLSAQAGAGIAVAMNKSASSTARATANASTNQHPADTTPQPVTGALSFIDNTVDRTSGTLRLRARVDNKTRALWPGNSSQ